MQTLRNTTGGLLVIAALAILLPLFPFAQGGSNPFDLSPRLSLPDVEEDTATAPGTGNPFDLVAPSKASAPSKPAVKPSARPEESAKAPAPLQNSYRTFLLITNILLLLLLTILLTIFRGQASKAYRAFLNDNLLSQLQREREAGGGIPYYLFYAYFLISAGFFIFLLASHYGQSFSGNHWISLLYCIGIAVALFLGKHLLLGFLAYVFPINKEMALYNFTIIVFSIILGFFLTIINLLLAYAPNEAIQGVLYSAYAGIGAIYLFRSLRGLFIGNRFALFHKFHFLLYICTVEIAPVLVLVKLILFS